jgi:hypothetical protein
MAGSLAPDVLRYLPACYESDGTVELKFIAGGVVCTIDIPLLHAAGWKVVKPRKGMQS